jgi:glycine C-acetyltransferase
MGKIVLQRYFKKKEYKTKSVPFDHFPHFFHPKKDIIHHFSIAIHHFIYKRYLQKIIFPYFYTFTTHYDNRTFCSFIKLKISTMDLFARIQNDAGPFGKYAGTDKEGYFLAPKLEGPIANRMMFQGKEVVCWSVNNYLGLANLPEIRKADTDATADWGLAYPMGSRLMTGNTSQHEQLETELASFVNKESAVLVNFGYQGILSAIDCLVTRRDVIVYDAESHACIVDGVRLHMGKRFAFEHNDIESLEKALIRAEKLVEGTEGGILVISEGVFGMRGDQGKLREIVALKEKYNFRLMVDDAHGFGVLGATGAGACEEQGIMDGIDVYFATFAKSMASIGAFFAGDLALTQYLRYNMRSQIFAKSLPMPFVVSARKRLAMIRESTTQKDKLWTIVNALQSGLKERGFDIGYTNSCVTPVYMKGSVEEALALVHDMRENHSVFCSIVVYPVIPKGMILLRLIPTASHTLEDVQITLEAFSAVAVRLKAGDYKVEAANF